MKITLSEEAEWFVADYAEKLGSNIDKAADELLKFSCGFYATHSPQEIVRADDEIKARLDKILGPRPLGGWREH
jgi:hypothetical protein